MLQATRCDTDLVAVRRKLVFAARTPKALKDTYAQYIGEHNLSRHFPGSTYIDPEAFAKVMLRIPDRNCIGEPTSTLVKKDAFRKFGYFNTRLSSLCDWEYFARVAVNTGLCYQDEPLAAFRIHGRSRSAELREHCSYLTEAID
jgi:hypothetical protein